MLDLLEAFKELNEIEAEEEAELKEGIFGKKNQGSGESPVATFKDGVSLTWSELQDPDNGEKYGYDADAISYTSIQFFNCTSLISIKIPDDVVRIGQYGFCDCTNLTSITIPDTLDSIGTEAFGGCSSLESIVFAGTKSEWSSISKGPDWIYNVPSELVHCSDGDAPLEEVEDDELYDELDDELDEGIFGKKKQKGNPNTFQVKFTVYNENGTAQYNNTFTEILGKKSAVEQLVDTMKDNGLGKRYKASSDPSE